MSKRVTPKRNKSKKSTRGTRNEVISRCNDAALGERAKVLVGAIDNDPFEIIGFTSIATAGLQSDVGELFDDLAKEDPRLGPTLWATVAETPFIQGFARPDPIVAKLLPAWLRHLDQATITGAMRRRESAQRDRSTYLVEVTMVPELVTTCVFELQHKHNDQIVGFHTVAAPIAAVARRYEKKFRHTCEQAYELAPLPDACQNLLIALDGAIARGPQSKSSCPPWPLNLPTATLVIELAINKIPTSDVLPYVAIRGSVGGTSPAAKRLRRSLATWPSDGPTSNGSMK